MATLNKSHLDLEAADADAVAGPGNDNNVGNRDHLDSTNISHSSNVDDHPEEENRASRVSVNEIIGVLDRRRDSSASDSDCSVEVDLEAGIQETKLHLSKSEKDCRICHLSLDATNQESGIPIELGCSCKDDLAAVHKQCAEAWFKIKGNK